MGKVTASTDIDKVSDDDVSRYTEMVVEDIVTQVNGNLTLQENLKCAIVSVTFSAAFTSVTVTHNLGRVPVGAAKFASNVTADIFSGSGGASGSTISLQATAPCTATLVIM